MKISEADWTAFWGTPTQPWIPLQPPGRLARRLEVLAIEQILEQTLSKAS